MTILERLERWRSEGAITGPQYETLAALALRRLFSVYLELNALLYLGVIFIVGGLAWIVQVYFEELGDAFILTTLSALLAACIYYCFWRAAGYSHGEVESPTLAFDYVLYAACLLLSVEVAYIETRIVLLGEAWDHYLLFLAGVFGTAAYRFDNRLVLSLALSSLAGWFGLRFSRVGILDADALRNHAILYGGLVVATGWWLQRAAIKKHFLETYLHVAANVIFIALLSGLGSGPASWMYLAGLIGACSIAAWRGWRYRRFVFVTYAVLYGYAGVSYQLLRRLQDSTLVLTYFVLTGTIVVISMILLARRLGRDA